MTSPFDTIKSISASPDNQRINGSLDVSGMNTFMVLRGLSYFPECILLADAFNATTAPPELVYDALHALITPKCNRYSKWKRLSPKFDDVTIEHIQSYFECGRRESFAIARQFELEDRLVDFLKRWDSTNQ